MSFRPTIRIHHTGALCQGQCPEFYPALRAARGRRACVRRRGDHGELRDAAGLGSDSPVIRKAPSRRGRIGAVAGSPGAV